jgi:hypothetical protein
MVILTADFKQGTAEKWLKLKHPNSHTKSPHVEVPAGL